MSVLSRLGERTTFRSFSHRNYRLFYAGNLASNTGTWIQRVAQDWLALELTHSPAALGVVTSLQFGPAIFFSLHGGQLADRVDKRRLLTWTNIVSGLASFAIGLLVVTDSATINWVYLLATILGIASALNSPVWQNFVPDLVGRDHLPNAIALNSMNFNIGRLIGPALSGYLITLFGTGPSFFINALSYVGVVWTMARMDPLEYYAQERRTEGDGTIREGLRYLRTRGDVIRIMVLVSFSGTFGLNYQMFTALMARDVFGRSADSFGLLGTFIAVGSVSGALLIARRTKPPTVRFVNVLVVVFALVTTASALAPSFVLYSLALPLCGFTALSMLSAANAYVQGNVLPAFRGRVMGVYMLVFIGGTPIGSMFVGTVSEAYSPRLAIFLCGAFVVLVAIGTALVPMRRRRVVDYGERYATDGE